MDRNTEHQPGDLALTTGHYEEVNVSGVRTGVLHHAKEGEPLPRTLRRFSWRLVKDGDEAGVHPDQSVLYLLEELERAFDRGIKMPQPQAELGVGMKTRTSLLRKAARCRRLADEINDEHAKRALRQAADQFEARAREAEPSVRRSRSADRRNLDRKE